MNLSYLVSKSEDKFTSFLLNSSKSTLDLSLNNFTPLNNDLIVYMNNVNRPFDPVRDLNPAPLTHTEELTRYLRTAQAAGILRLNQDRLFFQLNFTSTTEEERLSKILICVRRDHPN